MSKEKQPDVRKARKKKNMGKLPMVPEAQNTDRNTKNEFEQNNNT